MPSAPLIALLVTTSTGSLFWKSTGVATWSTPLHPSMAASKLSGSLRSALKILSFSAAPGRLVRKLMSLLFSGHMLQIRKINNNLVCSKKPAKGKKMGKGVIFSC